jgi:dipeptidase E
MDGSTRTPLFMADVASGHIVALGGGGFSMGDGLTPLDRFIIGLARRERPRVCFIPTASADSATYVARFYRAFAAHSEATDLTLYDSPGLPRQPLRTSELAAFVAHQDVFYVGGGNTAHLLALWRLHGLDRLLREAWLRGAVLAGISAGMICWFESGLTDSFGGLATLTDGLGLIAGSACPHYDGEPLRRGRYHEVIGAGLAAGYAADDHAALHFTGTALTEVVAERPTATAFHVRSGESGIVETPLAARQLTDAG